MIRGQHPGLHPGSVRANSPRLWVEAQLRRAQPDETRLGPKISFQEFKRIWPTWYKLRNKIDQVHVQTIWLEFYYGNRSQRKSDPCFWRPQSRNHTCSTSNRCWYKKLQDLIDGLRLQSRSHVIKALQRFRVRTKRRWTWTKFQMFWLSVRQIQSGGQLTVAGPCLRCMNSFIKLLLCAVWCQSFKMKRNSNTLQFIASTWIFLCGGDLGGNVTSKMGNWAHWITKTRRLTN